MTAPQKTQRDLFETAVIERMKESGFLEVEIRVECLARCDDGYQDEVINAGWHYWNAALAADSGDEEQPRYTTRRLHDEVRKAEERGRQEERECTTSPTGYYKRAAALLEKLRDEIGSGFGEGDIERIGDIVIARLRAWDKLDREDVKRRLSSPPAQSVAMKAFETNKEMLTAFGAEDIREGSRMCFQSDDVDIWESYYEVPFHALDRIRSSLSAQVQDVAIPEGWQLVPIKPTKDMAYAAACAHYGKKRVDQTGIEGISITVNNIDYNFSVAFRRFWKGALSSAPAKQEDGK
ncbi:hypothetical protein A6U97_02595 [Agrobacterium tumefaciens]|uniref:hypothetical protein n=1 Tax=Agrobacterium tumefaciens TaxID=358 RepID=UPI00080FFFD5|nr:hypothetical protein A6U97_02595 [Agrobacterium tumefaciens]